MTALLAGLVPDVVLLDRDLPDGSGLDLARWMRGRRAYDDSSRCGPRPQARRQASTSIRGCAKLSAS